MNKWFRRLGKAYLRPAATIRSQVEEGIRDASTLAMAMLFGLINLISLIPSMFSQAIVKQQPIEALLGAQIVSSIFFTPLILFAIAAIIHILCVGFRGKASWASSRRALVWSALVVSPLVLLTGLSDGVLAQNTRFILVAITGVVFLWQWASTLNEVEFS